MGKILKNYRLFTSRLFQLLIFLVVPIVSIAYSYFIEGLPYFVMIILSMAVYMGAEIILDNFVFGGALSKEGGIPEFLKTSNKGLEFFYKALCQNMVRQIVTEVIIFLGIRLIFCYRNGVDFFALKEWVSSIYIILITYACMQAGITAGRFRNEMFFQMLIATIAEIIMVLTVMLILKWGIIISNILAIILVVLTCAASVWFVKKKGESCCYD